METIAPLLGVAYAALLGISTPMEEESQYSQMLKMKDADGSPFFKTLEITLVCNVCKATGDKVKMATCPHMSHEVPSYIEQLNELHLFGLLNWRN